MKSSNPKTMKILFVALIMLASAASLLAQGQIVEETTPPITEAASGFIDDSSQVPLAPTLDSDFQPSFVSSSFNIQAVPEPSTWALFGVGLVFLLWKHKKYVSNSF